MTREQIVRAGRAGTPWEYVPLALAALWVMPGDVEVRFLLAAAYARLMLRTAALEQLDRLPPDALAEPSVLTLFEAVRALPGDRVGIDELQRVLVSNIEALRLRADGAVDLRPHVDAWRARASQREHFRARTGDLVWRVPGEAGGWERFDNQAEQAAALRLPHDAGANAVTYPPWYIVEGIDPPWIMARAFDSTSGRYDGFSPRVIVVQADVEQLMDGLAQVDLAARLGDSRVMAWAGADAGARLEEFVRGRALSGTRVTSVSIGLPTTRTRVSTTSQVVVDRAGKDADAETISARSRIDAMYVGRDRAWWAERFAEAMSGRGDKLRVLINTSRFSTFLKHSGADLAEALAAAGCDVCLLMEPDPHTLNEPLANLLAVEQHRPDLVILPNYLRRDVQTGFPAQVPFITWMQDAMPGLFDKAAGRSVGPLDFIAGNLREELFQRFEYPRSRALPVPMAASARKFHDGPVSESAARRFACEIAYVSHHSEPAEVLHARRVEEGRSSPALVSVMVALLPRILQVIDSPIAEGPITPRLRTITREEMQRSGLLLDERSMTALLNTYVYQIADRALRHRRLEQAAALARCRDWRMHLYGRGWEKHPTLGNLAKGELDHGDDLRACYQTAATHLHLSLHTAIHQRVFECALSGGLPICGLQADDLSQLEYLAGAHACRVCDPIAYDPRQSLGDGGRLLAYAIDSCEESRRYASFVQALGFAAPGMVCLNSVHADRLRSSPAEPIDGDGRSVWDLWPDAASVMFHDEASMERVLTRAVEDTAWRREASKSLRDRAKQRVTYDALAAQMLRFVRDGLASENTSDGRRWYDGRSQ